MGYDHARVWAGSWQGKNEARDNASTWRGARRGGATRKAVIVDGVDDFLYFGAVMLSRGNRERESKVSCPQAWGVGIMDGR